MLERIPKTTEQKSPMIEREQIPEVEPNRKVNAERNAQSVVVNAKNLSMSLTVCTNGGLDHQDDEQQMVIDDGSVLQQAGQVQSFDPPVVFSGTRPFRSPSSK